MITRGINYYNMNDLVKNFYLTLEAKSLEKIILETDLMKFIMGKESFIPVLKESTSRLNFFIGDYELYFVPKRSISQFLILLDFEKIVDDPIRYTESIENEIKKTRNEMEELYDDLSGDAEKFRDTSCYLIIYAVGEDGMRQLHKVLTGIPRSAYYYLTDSRIYQLDSGEAVFSDNGLPDGIYYFYNQQNEIVYTKDPEKGPNVGDE